MSLNLGMDHRELKVCKVYINDDHSLILTNFKVRSSLVKLLIALIPGPDVK